MTDDRTFESDDDPSAPQEYEQAWGEFDARVVPQPPGTLPREPQTVDEELIAAEEAAVVSHVTDEQRV
ncbi:MAG: hypothetical protein JHD16_11605, partial [Solirubrobacteraceae bacterium]|nr:hypothetical protein [Solirubrobacteraceae bacterium]